MQKTKWVRFLPLTALLLLLLSVLCACQKTVSTVPAVKSDLSIDSDTDTTQKNQDIAVLQTEAPVLRYMGQASIRITTPEGKTIYVDPYAGEAEDYSPAADLILVTHGHFDHNAVEKVTNRNGDCQVITHKEAVQDGRHILFELGYVTVQPVEAGYNAYHDVSDCVGYVLTFSNGKSVYISGDTSKTEQMAQMADMNIDYAFYCCDGVYNMGMEEAAECAELVGAKHNIPYHNTTSNAGEMFDQELAEQFNVPNRLVIPAGGEILVE